MTRWLLPLTALLFLVTCGPSPHRAPTQGQPVLKLAREAKAANLNANLSSEAQLTGLERVPVSTGAKFFVAARISSIEQFPCSRCHDRSVAQMRQASGAGPDLRAAHWEVRLHHARPGVLSCSSCHLGTSPDELHSLRGESISFDHSYEVCTQCHSRQASDWAGGAHGKRLGGWAAPRVVQTCVGCHNPHSPQLKSRWPAIATPTKGASTHE